MRRIPTMEELVASYWERLARSIERPNVRKARAPSPLRRRNSEKACRVEFTGAQLRKPKQPRKEESVTA